MTGMALSCYGCNGCFAMDTSMAADCPVTTGFVSRMLGAELFGVELLRFFPRVQRGGFCAGRMLRSGHFNGCWGPSPAQFPYPPGGPGPVVSYADPWAVYGRVNAPPAVIVPVEASLTDTKLMETPVALKPKEG